MILKIIFIIFVSTLECSLVAAQDFNTQIAVIGDSLTKKIISSKKTKIAITDFINLDGTVTQLGEFLSLEISSELANLTDNQTKFRVLERSKLEQIFKEKRLVTSVDGSKLAEELGKIDAADVLIIASITDFDGYFRVVIKLLDTKNGDALSSYKINFIKTPSLENFNKIIVKNNSATSVIPAKTNTDSKNADLEKVGEFCFKNDLRPFSIIDPPRCAVKIIDNKTGNVLFNISVSNNDTRCIPELPLGIYKVELNWQNGSRPHTEFQVIKVLPGKSLLSIK